MAARRIRPLGKLLSEPFDDDEVDELHESIMERVDGEEPRKVWRWQYGVALVAAAAIIVVLSFWGGEDLSQPSSSAPGPIRLVSGPILESIRGEDTAPQQVELDDGSLIELDLETSIRATTNTGERLVLEMSRGRASFFVEPNGPRAWTIQAGIASVDVVGTQFVVESGELCVVVAVSRGVVRVSSELLESARRLEVEQRIEVCRIEEPIEEPELDSERGDETSNAVDAGQEERPEWRSLASEGAYDAAYELLGSEGVRQLTERALTVSELMELADVARLSGHPHEAVEPLERILESYSNDRRAPVAAFTLGRIQADSLGNHHRSAHAFTLCLELGPPRALREDAYARLAESLARSGNSQRAKAVVREYLREFPSGRRARDLSRLIGELESP